MPLLLKVFSTRALSERTLLSEYRLADDRGFLALSIFRPLLLADIVLCERLALFALRAHPLAPLDDVLVTLLLLTPRVLLASRKGFLADNRLLPVPGGALIQLSLDDEADRRAFIDRVCSQTMPDDLLFDGLDFVALRLALWLMLDDLSVDEPRLLVLLLCPPFVLRFFPLRLLPENEELDRREVLVVPSIPVVKLDDLVLGFRFTLALRIRVLLPMFLLGDCRVDTVLLNVRLVPLLLLEDLLERAAFLAVSFRPLPLMDDLRFCAPRLVAMLV